MKDKPLVSVILPTYNGAECIAEAIQSVLDQTYPNIELIVVDDGSTDGTKTIVESFSDKGVQFVAKPKNSGIADSLNVGILKAKGQYFARMDDDDVCMPERLMAQVEFLEQHPDVVVCATNDQNKGGDRPYLTDTELKIGLLFRNVIIHPSVMMPMEVIKKYMYTVDMVPSEDYDLWSRLLNEGKFYKLEEPLMFYRCSANGQTATRRQEQLRLNVDIFKRIAKCYGFNWDRKYESVVYQYISHDYSMPAFTLLKLIEWFDQLLIQNNTKEMFPKSAFENELRYQENTFVTKYFYNRTLKDKIMPFFKLPLRLKLQVIKFYLSKKKV